jgi:sulfatase maturation enzyme AslB (radical SAM superfamily)
VSQAQWAFGHTLMCCNDTEGVSLSLQDEWNCKARKSTRRAWMNGQVPKRCRRCISDHYHEHEHGLLGYYDQTISVSAEDLIAMCKPDGTMTHNPKYLHVSPSSKCQLACKMCNKGTSTQYDRVFSNGDGVAIQNSDAIERVIECADSLEFVVLHGGEPVLAPDLKTMIDALEPFASKVGMSVLTNGMTLKGKGITLFEILDRFEYAEVIVSLDGTKPANDGQRVFASFDKIVGNLKAIHEQFPLVRIKVNHTLTNMNAADLPEFYRALQRELPFVAMLNHGVVVSPKHYAVHNMPEQERLALMSKLNAANLDEFPPQVVGEFEKVRTRIDTFFRKNEFDRELYKQYLKEEIDKGRLIAKFKMND